MDFIHDALSAGQVPSMLDVPDGLFSVETDISWGGDKSSKMNALFQTSKERDLLLNFDRVPLIPQEQKKAFIAQIQKMMMANRRRED